ncbi:MAG: HD domain-containing phosphohydrolase [Anaerolineae bacterium]
MTISGPAQILVVEDELVVGELIVQVLERAGYRAVLVSQGYDALERLAANRYDLMITDLRMPGMGGVELVERTRDLFPDVDIMVLTAHATLESAIQILKMGAYDYILKPFDIPDLTNKVDQCLARRFERLAARLAPPQALVALHRAIARAPDSDTACQEIVRLICEWFVVDELLLTFRAIWPSQVPCVSLLPTLVDIPIRIIEPAAGERDALAPVTWVRRDPWLLEGLAPTSPGGSPRHGLTIVLESAGDQLGSLQLIRHAEGGRYTESEAQSLYIYGAQLAQALLQTRAHLELLTAFSDLSEITTSAARTLVDALGAYDDSTREHSLRVADFARRLAERLGLSAQDVKTIGVAGLLHDIGKLGVAGKTLRKNGRLSEDERESVLLHPVQGAQILSGMQSLRQVVPLVRHHHERIDGGGYPDGLAGEQIPLGARLLAVVDAYDSMTSDRPYRSTLEHDEAVRRLSRGAGVQWDAELVALWLECLADEREPALAMAAMES